MPSSAPRPRRGAFFRCLAVCDFDVDVGQVTRAVFPPGALTPVENAKIAYLALPDSNTHTPDVVYTFRLRRCVLAARLCVRVFSGPGGR